MRVEQTANDDEDWAKAQAEPDRALASGDVLSVRVNYGQLRTKQRTQPEYYDAVDGLTGPNRAICARVETSLNTYDDRKRGEGSMTAEKIAILVDSGCDVPADYRDTYRMYVAPLTIIYKDAEYRDGIDIDPDTVFARFEEEIPTTSLPSPATVADLFKQIKADGYEKVIVVAISSGLSGTFEMLSGFGPTPEGLEAYYVDTKNIGIGSGLTAIRAGELIEQGLSFDEVCRQTELAAKNTRVFFCVATLEYLLKGGRIGLVSGMVGMLLDVKPVISCNDDGVYYTVAKARGRDKSLRLALDKAVEFAEGAKEYSIAVVQGAAEAEATALMTAMKERLPDFRYAIEEQLTPVLVVHTGPGLIGIGVQRLD